MYFLKVFKNITTCMYMYLSKNVISFEKGKLIIVCLLTKWEINFFVFWPEKKCFLSTCEATHERISHKKTICYWSSFLLWFTVSLSPRTFQRYLARRLRAKFWPDCAIPDTSMKIGTVVDHDWLSRRGYRITLENAYCACATHFMI